MGQSRNKHSIKRWENINVALFFRTLVQDVPQIYDDISLKKYIYGASGSFSTSHLLRPFSSFWNENLPLAKLKSVKLWIFQFRFRKKTSQLIFKLFLNTVDCKECFGSKNRNFDNKTKRWGDILNFFSLFFTFKLETGWLNCL